jgi:hypothetical protein
MHENGNVLVNMFISWGHAAIKIIITQITGCRYQAVGRNISWGGEKDVVSWYIRNVSFHQYPGWAIECLRSEVMNVTPRKAVWKTLLERWLNDNAWKWKCISKHVHLLRTNCDKNIITHITGCRYQAVGRNISWGGGGGEKGGVSWYTRNVSFHQYPGWAVEPLHSAS